MSADMVFFMLGTQEHVCNSCGIQAIGVPATEELLYDLTIFLGLCTVVNVVTGATNFLLQHLLSCSLV